MTHKTTVLIAEDEPLAAEALAAWVREMPERLELVAVCHDGDSACEQVLALRPGLVLLDIQMPGPDGLMLAESLQHRPGSPLVVFVTAHAKHAVEAFGLDAVDYLTKPFRAERLQSALVRVAQRLREREAAAQLEPRPTDEGETLSIHERGRVLRVPIAEVLYIKAELKYLTVRTAQHRHVMDGSLNDIEQRMGHRFLRVHRNALVAKAAVRELARHQPGQEELPVDFGAPEPDCAETWSVRVAPVNEWLQVSRRQLAAVREALRGADQ